MMLKWPHWWLELPPGARVLLVLGFLLGVPMFVVGILDPVGSRRPTPAGYCKHNLRLIELALRQYHAEYGAYPPLVGPQNRRPAHSWRVLILPYLGHQHVYEAYHLDEPWDSPHNLEFAESVPGEFVCPAFKERFSKSHPGATSYLALPAFERIEGPRGHWEDTHPTDQFLAVYEIDEPRVLWTEPADLDKVYESFTMGRTPTASFHDTVHLEFLPVAIRKIQPAGAQDDAQE